MPIPSHVTGYVAGRNDSGAQLFPILRGGNIPFVIETPPPENFPVLPPKHVVGDIDTNNALEDIERQHQFKLMQIQTVIRTIDFEKANWAYFTVQSDGSYRITYRRKRLRPLTCPIWAPLVKESEITITKWLNCEHREGIWRNILVDVHIGWEDAGATQLNRIAWGRWKLRNLDVTYELLGHVVRDGQVVGFITELAVGRLVRCGDEAAVYEAFARLQRHGLVFKCIDWMDTMISPEGKVRILYPSVVESYLDDPQRLEEEAQTHHWEEIRLMFEDLANDRTLPVLPLYKRSETITILADMPPPERLLGTIFPQQYSTYVWNDSASKKSQKSKKSKLPRKALALIASTDSPQGHTYPDNLFPLSDAADASVGRQTTVPDDETKGCHPSPYYHPYRRRARYQHIVLASALDDFECESSTTSSIVEVSEFDKSWMRPDRDSNTPVSSPEDY